MLRSFGALISSRLGRCSRCMRLSLMSAMLGWCGFGTAHYFWPATHSDAGILLWPASATALWLLHIGAYAVRRSNSVGNGVLLSERPAEGRVGVEHSDVSHRHGVSGCPPTRLNRRALLQALAKSGTIALLASLPALSPVTAQTRVDKCLDCCAGRLKDCYDSEGRTKRCDTLYQNCVANCRSRGETPSNWNCW